MSNISFWLISGIALLFLMVLTFMVIINSPKPQDEIIPTTPTPITEEETPDEKKDVAVLNEEKETQINSDVLPPAVSVEEPLRQNETKNNQDIQTTEESEEILFDLPLVSTGFGRGLNSEHVRGNFGHRSGGAKKRAVMRGGGSRATESAVDSALWWLATHQEDEGHWDSSKWEGAGTPEVDATCTGLALLAFLGAGHTDRAGKFKANVKKAIDWLLKVQRPDGSFGNRNDTNGICTMALAEAYGMGYHITKLRQSLELAADFLLKQQNDSGGFDYVRNNTRDDMSVSSWCIMSLKLASLVEVRERDINIAFKEFEKLMDEQKETTGDNTPNSKGLSWSDLEQGKQSNQESSQTAVAAIAMLMRQHLGWKRTEPWLQAATRAQANHLPLDFEDIDVYRIYYTHQALFQQGGKEWEAWNKTVSKIIVKAQRMDGDFKGSWDNNNHGHIKSGGRILATALLCLSLEVYYRYESVMKD